MRVHGNADSIPADKWATEIVNQFRASLLGFAKECQANNIPLPSVEQTLRVLAFALPVTPPEGEETAGPEEGGCALLALRQRPDQR
jgi:hypothetical protein